MLLRWLRSDVRENLLMTVHFFKNFRFSLAYAAFAFHLGSLVLGTVMPLISLPVMVDMICRYSPAGVFHALYYGAVLGFIGALIPAMIYAKRVSVLNSVWAVVYSVYNLFLLSWIPVYAFFTARNSNWLTREITANRKGIEKISGMCTGDTGHCNH